MDVADPSPPGRRRVEEIAYDVTGVGDPVVLLHGVGSRRGVWAPIVGALAERHRVYALDLPGFGESPDGGEPATVDSLADDVAAFCASRLIARPHLVGNSMGGGIALMLGTRGLAASVTAFSPIGFWRKPGLAWCRTALGLERAGGRVLRGRIPALITNPVARTALVGLGFGHPSRLDDDAIIADVDALLDCTGMTTALTSFGGVTFDTELARSPELSAIPVTVAWGTRDILLTAATQPRRARASLPGAVHTRLPGCGHVPFNDDPGLCADAVLRTIARAAQPGVGTDS